MYKGRYVATVIIDFLMDDTELTLLPFEKIKNTICRGELDKALKEMLSDELRNTAQSVEVQRTYADFYQVSKEDTTKK